LFELAFERIAGAVLQSRAIFPVTASGATGAAMRPVVVRHWGLAAQNGIGGLPYEFATPMAQ